MNSGEGLYQTTCELYRTHPEMVKTNDQLKELLGCRVAELVRPGQMIGFGSGSTSEMAIRIIGERVQRNNITITAVATSGKMAELSRSFGIQTIDALSLDGSQTPIVCDWGFDGADEVLVPSAYMNIVPGEHDISYPYAPTLIKGGGGAHTLEKKVARLCSKSWIILADSSKLVTQLGTRFPIPVEVDEQHLEEIQEWFTRQYNPLRIVHRAQKSDPTKYFVTDSGNPILDVWVAPGTIEESWEQEIERQNGVAGCGLFGASYASEVWVAHPGGILQKFINPRNNTTI